MGKWDTSPELTGLNSLLSLHFFNRDLWMDGVCLTFPEQVNDFLVGQGLFINLPNKNILQVLSKNHEY